MDVPIRSVLVAVLFPVFGRQHGKVQGFLGPARQAFHRARCFRAIEVLQYVVTQHQIVAPLAPEGIERSKLAAAALTRVFAPVESVDTNPRPGAPQSCVQKTKTAPRIEHRANSTIKHVKIAGNKRAHPLEIIWFGNARLWRFVVTLVITLIKTLFSHRSFSQWAGLWFRAAAKLIAVFYGSLSCAPGRKPAVETNPNPTLPPIRQVIWSAGVIALMLNAGCARHLDETEVTDRFWAAVAKQRIEQAQFYLRAGEAELLDHRSPLLEISNHSIGRIVIDGQQAAITTTLALRGSSSEISSLTILAREGEYWRVDYAATLKNFEAGRQLLALQERVAALASTVEQGIAQAGDEVRRALPILEQELSRLQSQLEAQMPALQASLGDFLQRLEETLEKAPPISTEDHGITAAPDKPLPL